MEIIGTLTVEQKEGVCRIDPEPGRSRPDTLHINPEAEAKVFEQMVVYNGESMFRIDEVFDMDTS